MSMAEEPLLDPRPALYACTTMIAPSCAPLKDTGFDDKRPTIAVRENHTIYKGEANGRQATVS